MLATAPSERIAHVGATLEFDFQDGDFRRVCELIYRRAGIHLQDGKQAMVYSRLSRRLRELGVGSFAAYLQSLESAGGAPAEQEWQAFVNCLTTNLTSFFREAHHFPILAAELRSRATELHSQRGRPLRLWCNAASTGEEPYSLAMTVIETLGETAAVQIVCSDIDTQVLATAQRGVYEATARGLSEEHLRRHFMRGAGANKGSVRVKPALQRLIQFQAFNLMDRQWSLGEAFDIVFCRNVMIYFDPATQLKVLERMHGAMRPGALLFAGHSENFQSASRWFRLRANTVYERV